MTLYIRAGNRYRVATPSQICESANEYLIGVASKARAKLMSPRDAKAIISAQAGLDHEQFGCVFLDSRHRVLSVEILFYGTINGASVHPREVVKRALQLGAAAVIAFHNHPSGDAQPSVADELITQRMRDALALIDARLIDHLIVGTEGVVSLAEIGLV